MLGALDREGIVPVSVALREPSLDDVFFALTGRPAEAGGQTNATADDEAGDSAVDLVRAEEGAL